MYQVTKNIATWFRQHRAVTPVTECETYVPQLTTPLMPHRRTEGTSLWDSNNSCSLYSA